MHPGALTVPKSRRGQHHAAMERHEVWLLPLPRLDILVRVGAVADALLAQMDVDAAEQCLGELDERATREASAPAGAREGPVKRNAGWARLGVGVTGRRFGGSTVALDGMGWRPRRQTTPWLGQRLDRWDPHRGRRRYRGRHGHGVVTARPVGRQDERRARQAEVAASPDRQRCADAVGGCLAVGSYGLEGRLDRRPGLKRRKFGCGGEAGSPVAAVALRAEDGRGRRPPAGPALRTL
jgi:hypothetical protein